jgi:hypothetical protein
VGDVQEIDEPPPRAVKDREEAPMGAPRDDTSPRDASEDDRGPDPAPPRAGDDDLEALLGTLPPRLRRVTARRALTRDSLPERGGCADDPQLSEAAQRVWDAERALALTLAAQYRALAELHEHEGEYEEVTAFDEVDTLRAALGLRVTRTAAAWQLRDAYQAVHHLPRALEDLESGAIPSAWFQRMLRTSRKLSDRSRTELDLIVSTWSPDISPERFFTLLKALIEHLAQRESLPDPREGLDRNVELLPGHEPGTGVLHITGPIPEILSRWKSLDESAQAAQRAALREGTPIPHDADGTVRRTGRALPLAGLRFALMAGADLDVDGVGVPAERFRLNVTVPVLTLLGASDEPGTLDGTIPLPPSMARSLAGAAEVWHRVLTAPVGGAFLPLPADRMVPTPAMLEHLRLRNGQCAVPGCTRPSSWASECDHIEECLRGTPDAGGPTDIENLHLLCWQHHLDKTNGLLDPTRIPTPATEPGRTRWKIGHAGDAVTVIDDLDLASPRMVEMLTAAWTSFLRGHHAGSPVTSPARPGTEPETTAPAPPAASRPPASSPPSSPPPPAHRPPITAPRPHGASPSRPGPDPRAATPPPALPPPRSAPPPGPVPGADLPDAPPGGWGDYGPPPF